MDANAPRRAGGRRLPAGGVTVGGGRGRARRRGRDRILRLGAQRWHRTASTVGGAARHAHQPFPRADGGRRCRHRCAVFVLRGPVHIRGNSPEAPELATPPGEPPPRDHAGGARGARIVQVRRGPRSGDPARSDRSGRLHGPLSAEVRTGVRRLAGVGRHRAQPRRTRRLVAVGPRPPGLAGAARHDAPRRRWPTFWRRHSTIFAPRATRAGR